MEANFFSIDSERRLSLHEAAAKGDEVTVRRLIAHDADVNAVDATGKSVIAHLIIGDTSTGNDAPNASTEARGRLNILRFLLESRKSSLYTLNAPHAGLSGATPLATAAYLDQLEFVSVLLEKSHDLVSVDARDSFGTTPLMYAARDSGTDVVHCLLAHHARPDRRDRNCYSAVQYALPHPQTLWLCEEALRRHRATELKSDRTKEKLKLSIPAPPLPCSSLPRPPSLMTFSTAYMTGFVQSLTDAITSSNLSTVQSLLFPSVQLSASSSPIINTPVALINRPDAKGWSLIHYCTTAPLPSIEILDTLFLAGADLGLFTSIDHSTPLHCLVRATLAFGKDEAFSQLLYSFIVHLIRDLRAPLAAQDASGETCIHLAAEHGEHCVILMALLDCDTSGAVSEIRNSRGLTAFEVVKPEFRFVFAPEDIFMRPGSCASNRTIRPSPSKTSISSLESSSEFDLTLGQPSRYLSPSPDLAIVASDVPSATQQILENLVTISRELCDDSPFSHLDTLQCLVQETVTMGDLVLGHFRNKMNETLGEVKEFRRVNAKIDATMDRVHERIQTKRRKQLLYRKPSYEAIESWSPSSQRSASSLTGSTLVNSPYSSAYPPSSASSVFLTNPESPRSFFDHDDSSTPSVNEQPPLRIVTAKKKWPSWLNPFIIKANSETYKTHLSNLLEIEKALFGRSTHPSRSTENNQDSQSKKKSRRSKSSAPSRRKERPEHEGGSYHTDSTAAVAGNTNTSIRVARSRALSTNSASAREVATLTSSFKRHVTAVASPAQARRDHTLAIDTISLRSTHLMGKDKATVSAVSPSPAGSELFVLEATRKDACSIDECLITLEQTIADGFRSLAQAERHMIKIIKPMEDKIQAARICQSWTDASDDSDSDSDSDDDMNAERCLTPNLFTYASPMLSPSSLSAPSPSPSPSISPFPTLSSSGSTASLTSLLTGEEDGSLRMLRRLIVRKIPARIVGMSEDVEKVSQWLAVLRATMRTLYRRAED